MDYSYEVSHFVLRKDEKQAPYHVKYFDDFAPAMNYYKSERDKIYEILNDGGAEEWVAILTKIHQRGRTQVNDEIKHEGTF